MSREPKEGELLPGARLVRFARATVVLAGGSDVPDVSLSEEELASLVTGKVTTCPDGRAAPVILREPGGSATEVFGRAFPLFGAAQTQATLLGT